MIIRVRNRRWGVGREFWVERFVWIEFCGEGGNGVFKILESFNGWNINSKEVVWGGVGETVR